MGVKNVITIIMASFYMIFSDEDDEEFASKAPADEAADDLAG